MLAPCLVSSEGSLLGLQRAAFSLCPYTTFPLCFHILGVCVYIFSSYKDTSQIGLGPPLWRPHFQMHSHFQILWFRVSTYEFRRNTTEPIIRHHDSLSHLPLRFICNLLDLLKIDLLLTDERLLHIPNLMSGQTTPVHNRQLRIHRAQC